MDALGRIWASIAAMYRAAAQSPAPKKGMAQLISLFIGFAGIIVVLQTVVLLAGTVDSTTSSMFTSLNVSDTWSTLSTSAVTLIQNSIRVGTLGILVYAFMAVLSAFGIMGASGRR